MSCMSCLPLTRALFPILSVLVCIESPLFSITEGDKSHCIGIIQLPTLDALQLPDAIYGKQRGRVCVVIKLCCNIMLSHHVMST